jgi:hypothetical protein
VPRQKIVWIPAALNNSGMAGNRTCKHTGSVQIPQHDADHDLDYEDDFGKWYY